MPPPPQTTDPVVGPIATGLIAAMVDVFAVLDDALGEPHRPVCLRTGTVPTLLASQTEDECCLRLVWLRQTQMYPSVQGNFPDPDGNPVPCDIRRWAVGFELGASRCAPVATETALPTCAAWTDVTMALYDDAAALRRSLLAWQQDHPYEAIAVVGGEPGEVSGGCVYTTVTILVAAAACDQWDGGT